ncbi:TetR/AcrR family transcriptional regulator [Nonomuraea roseoviolacea]|uniref:AcrR family transcriptional regulator n=1 Tax=Nonomuraea roseoviolacea subsp. carminata TaxID=160689 RepID=A0ABT1JVX7_9ACTN|nr:TetR/AcrR family transcriptional regulator [Nonomuraea roseoviolacea]MCP2345552.1 AcrR family transcriptional regulator [Nonomuraea roseoviolacea subsp. carminata]
MELGLRETKKLQTQREIWETAIRMFVERDFDDVSVAEIAAAVQVSRKTVFNYFATKEDIVVSPMEAHVEDPAVVVRERAPGETAVAALRRDYLDLLARRDASVGLSDAPHVLAVMRLILSTPTLTTRAYAFHERARELLARELAVQSGHDDVTARVAAAQIVSTRAALAGENLRRLLGGESSDAVYPDAVADAERAFDLLEHGLGDYCARTEGAA